MDTTATFRFSGLPNNAQLELVNATKVRSDSDVTLALNLENGNRVIGTFNPNVTLLTILKNLCPESASEDKNPVVIYTRREIYGTELEIVTLKSLGITGGRAMLRLIHKAPEELKVQANVAAPLPSKPVEEKPYVRKLQKSPEPESPKQSSNQKSLKEDPNKNKDDEKDTKQKSIQKSGKVDLLKLAKEKRKSTDIPIGNKEKRVTLNDKVNKSDKQKAVNCQCKAHKSGETDCNKKCHESCSNLPEPDVEDEFIFVSYFILQSLG